jgi:hypothetical protein
MYSHRHTHESNEQTWLEHTGPWDIPTKARVLCADGVYRTARTAQTADTFFSLPARVTVKGKTVSGFVTTEDNPLVAYRTVQGSPALGYIFIPYQYGKNHAMLPEWHPFESIV